MDAVSYAHSAKQAQRIKKFIENPDSNSGVITQPSVIQAGEVVTVPTGRTAILANTQIDGTLTVNGTVFIPSGATTNDIETELSTKVDKVTSTDNAIVRFDGTTGNVQNSNVFITDSGNLLVGITTDNGVDKLQVNGSMTHKSSAYKYTNANDACVVNEQTIVSSSCLNIPYEDYGYLSVIVSSSNLYCMQTFTGLNAPVRLFIRIMAGGNWSAWTEK